MTIVIGKVKKGDGFGQRLNYPTANLDYKIKPRLAEGSYAGVALVGEKFYKSSIFIGAPRTTRQKFRVEAYLFNFSGRLYGKKMSVFIYSKVRPNLKLKTLNELKLKLAEDKKKTRKIFKTKKFNKWYFQLSSRT
ncbi:MAG: FMN adenylyltransferase [Candidatus Doudnabacteria bacterium CG10_big_fil_rev_8_21_14_0_10_41_10]|uniref:riboflavin kinase n=1 Tax=Candidatus Doudnabacteria bacterium CG10_big_fil_rev_8_21_14_0_10_41_10 TaxID=1974551 RepID=A0A2H0VCI2_9BACT|nr:MAG: FMN adenylyltransferase [Candidatus Doudnabacteria bacterium CG10_big_fil_rev_8_21_14_0_10_41_10]